MMKKNVRDWYGREQEECVRKRKQHDAQTTGVYAE